MITEVGPIDRMIRVVLGVLGRQLFGYKCCPKLR